MAIETPSALESGRDPSVIENEIPAYRAISARAVTSIVLGLASVFCFTSPYFLLLVAGAVAFGWSGLVAIRRYPDILTGSSLARAGIGLSLAFGLSAIAQGLIADWNLTRQASAFATNFVNVLQKESLANAVWYEQEPAYRKEKTPDALLEELKAVKTPPNFYDTQTSSIEAIKARLAEPNQDIHFAGIESKLIDGLTHHANALVDLDGPATAKHPEKEEFALLVMMRGPDAGAGDWKIKSLIYPYKPASLGVQVEHKADDGHGH